jgi:anti-sigma factor RsiW
MNSIEEKLWNYIDGNCPPDEQKAITMLIEQDEVYRKKYNELQQLNGEFAAMELDEPSMAFSYNVMEAIRTEHAKQPLKAAVDKRIILGIASFFVLTLSVIVIYMFSSVNWAAGSGVQIPEQLNMQVPHVNTFFTGPIVKAFLFFDLVMGLFLLDYYLRRKTAVK